MRKGRYVTKNEFDEIDEITGLTWDIDLKNNVSIKWDWPRNGAIKLGLVFFAEKPDDSLEDILKTQPEPYVVTKDMGKFYLKPLDAEKRYFKVYPGYFGGGSDIIVLNQIRENSTDLISKMITVSYKIEYKQVPLSDFQKVTMTIKSTERLQSDTAIAYAKFKNLTHICSYPLSAERNFSYAFYIKKNESIRLYASDEFSKNICMKEMQ